MKKVIVKVNKKHKPFQKAEWRQSSIPQLGYYYKSSVMDNKIKQLKTAGKEGHYGGETE